MTTPMHAPDDSGQVGHAWQAHAADVPPPALDAAILAAAHRAANSAPVAAMGKRAAPLAPRWWLPLAAAATLGAVTLSVVQLAPVGDEAFAPVETSSRAAPAPAPAPASEPMKSAASSATKAAASAPDLTKAPNTARADQAPSPAQAPQPESRIQSPEPASLRQPLPNRLLAREALPVPTENTAAPAATAKLDAAATAGTPAAPAAAAAAPTPTPAPATPTFATAPAPEPFPAAAGGLRKAPSQSAMAPAARREADEAPAGGSARDRAAAQAAPPAPLANSLAGERLRSGASPEVAAQPGSMTPTNADDWLARIAKLHKDGDDSAAATELRAFRAAYVDADRRMPPELRAWAATVRQ